jgi:hypothetical protein
MEARRWKEDRPENGTIADYRIKTWIRRVWLG